MDKTNSLGERGFASVFLVFLLILVPLSYFVGRQLEIRQQQIFVEKPEFFLGRNFEDYPYENGLRTRVFYPYPIAVWENGWFYYFVQPIDGGYLIETPFENIVFTLGSVSYENDTSESWSVNGSEVIWNDIGWNGNKIWRVGTSGAGVFREEVELREKLPPIVRGIFTSEVKGEVNVEWKVQGEVENLGMFGLRQVYLVNGNLVAVEGAEVREGSFDAVWKREVGEGTSVIVDPVVSFTPVGFETYIKYENLQTGERGEVLYSSIVASGWASSSDLVTVFAGYTAWDFDWVGVENVVLSFLFGKSWTVRNASEQDVPVAVKVSRVAEVAGFNDIISGTYLGQMTVKGNYNNLYSWSFELGNLLNDKPDSLNLGFYDGAELPPPSNTPMNLIAFLEWEGSSNSAIKVVYYPQAEMPSVNITVNPNVLRFQVGQAGSRNTSLTVNFNNFDREPLTDGYRLESFFTFSVDAPEGVRVIAVTLGGEVNLNGQTVYGSCGLNCRVEVPALLEGEHFIYISGTPWWDAVLPEGERRVDAPYVRVSPVKISLRVTSWITLSVQDQVNTFQTKSLEIPVGVRVHNDLIGHNINFTVSGKPENTKMEIENIVGGVEETKLRIVTENAPLGKYRITLTAYCPDFEVSSSASFILNVSKDVAILVVEPIEGIQPNYSIGDTIKPRVKVRNEGNLDWEGYYSWILNLWVETYGDSFPGRVPAGGDNTFSWDFKLPVAGHGVLTFKIGGISTTSEFDVPPVKPKVIPWSYILPCLVLILVVSSYYLGRRTTLKRR